MNLRTLDSIDLKNKIVLYRAPYDIELKNVDGVLEPADYMRILATIPTLKYLLKENCKIVILTYVGRPNGVEENLRTRPHAIKLASLLNHPVDTIGDCIGPVVEDKIARMQYGDILMLENVRFYKEEMSADETFAKTLCVGKDVIVFDGFPQAHRVHASTTGILKFLPSVSGLYLAEEVSRLSNLLENPQRPFTVIIGGAKISDKVDAVNNLLEKADRVLVGGAVANVFLKAQGHNLGNSFVEDVFVDEKRREKKDWVVYAKEILEKYKDKIVLPIDLVISDGVSAKNIDISKEEVPAGWSAFDIGAETQDLFKKKISESKTVFWSGPMGKFEDEKFAVGSKAVISAMKDVVGETIIAGGDTIDVTRQYGKLEDYSLVSLAGGATLEFLAGKELPVLKMLQ